MKRLFGFLLSLAVAFPLFGAWSQPVRARSAMVASTSEIASRVGSDVMKRGGNAVDAAVAVGLALAVTWPSAGNLGGGGFMLVRKADGTTEAIDYRERGPLAAHRDMYLDAQGNLIKGMSTDGYRAVAVPGTVAGLVLAHKRHGKLKWEELVEPARKLAAEGFEVNFHLARSLTYNSTIEKMKPWAESWRIYQRDGKYYELGETFMQPELAAVLARIKTNPRDFYEGETAKLIVADMKANGGIVTMEDLRTYEPTIRQPLRTTYRGYEILTMPPPSSGGIALIEMLNMLEPYDLKAMGWHSSQSVHTMVEVMRRAFADRAAYLGDADFVKVPVRGLTSRAYAQSRAKNIGDRATPSLDLRGGGPAAYESPETTHYSIVDPEGNVVSNTYTLNDSYGSGVTAKGTGILLNNEMDDFTSKVGVANDYGLIQGEANAIAPKKRPLSSMTPTIVLKDGKPYFVIGSPGGPTIINTVLQAIVNIIDFDMDIQAAVSAPRFHHQWLPDHIFWETFDFAADTRTALEARGHKFRNIPGMDRTTPGEIGDAQGVMIDPRTGMRMGGSDPRRGGVSVGW
ncbi:MAG TPA: gamma-glutamyltransferase [Thermoanaerobaculia bacterium]|jgi:gamma-glutamyltranspeptidase/glutathione hydrolase|nr:gamma-glutamyltransferase [Thermoanaerobaculia bacterium]